MFTVHHKASIRFVALVPCQSESRDSGPSVVYIIMSMAAAALGKLTRLVFEKPGKKFFGT